MFWRINLDSKFPFFRCLTVVMFGLGRSFFSSSRNHIYSNFRCLSNAEVSTALRPFYFLVHPDLFGKHPKEQAENEVNLKTLKNYVDTMVDGHRKPNPKDVRFFVRSKTVSKAALPIIRIRLKDTTLRRTLLAILKGGERETCAWCRN